MWNIIYTNYIKLVKDTTILNFHFKITHRILACNYNLEIWQIRQDNRCDHCKEIDTIEHMLIYCQNTYIFWQQIFNWWAKNMNVWFEVGTYEIIFGIPNENNENTVNQLNFFIIIAKYFIKHKKAGKALHVYEFLLELKNRVAMKKIVEDELSETTFNKKWAELHDVL